MTRNLDDSIAMRRFAHIVLAGLLAVGALSDASAQSARLTPIVGVTRPLAGEMTMWLPLPVVSGFDSAAYKHRFDPGTTVGLLVEYERAGWLDVAAQMTANFAKRRVIGEDGQDRTCDCTESVIYGLSVLATASNRVGEKSRVYAGLGPEALYFSGNAVSNSDGFPAPAKLEVSPRLIVGALGVLGAEYDLSSKLSLRLHAAYRYYAPRYEPEDPTPPVSYSTEANHDLLVTLGFSLRRAPSSAP